MVDTTEDQLSNRIKQLSVFLPNRLGAVLSLNRSLKAAQIRIVALTILDAADHAVVRLVVDQPTLAREILTTEGLGVMEHDLLCVALPGDDGLERLLAAIIMAELNIHYIYSLMAAAGGRPLLALKVEHPESAAAALARKGMRLLNHDDLPPLLGTR